MEYQPADQVYFLTSGGWPETEERWRKEGWDGTPLEDVFGSDHMLWSGDLFWPNPPFEEKTLEEDDHTRVFVNEEGIVMKVLKDHRYSSMPQFVRFPVESREDFRKFAKERLQPNLMERMGPDAEDTFRQWRERTAPLFVVADRWGGFFGSIRNLVGVENLCMMLHDDPAFVEEMMDYFAEYQIEMMRQVLDHTDIDVFGFWEDMAYKTAPLIGPDMVRKYMLPRYRKVVDYLSSRGVKYFSLDSDGDITSLVPVWLDAGINLIYPFEVQAGMDCVKFRKEFGKELRMWGNIDKKAIADGPARIDAEFDRVRPLIEEGGYLPWVDHSCPPDISWENYCYYIKKLGEECRAAGKL